MPRVEIQSNYEGKKRKHVGNKKTTRQGAIGGASWNVGLQHVHPLLRYSVIFIMNSDYNLNRWKYLHSNYLLVFNIFDTFFSFFSILSPVFQPVNFFFLSIFPFFCEFIYHFAVFSILKERWNRMVYTLMKIHKNWKIFKEK